RPSATDGIYALAKKVGKMQKRNFVSTVENFYLANSIARASATMAQCSLVAQSCEKRIFDSAKELG
nr:hypothetical protein [Candidatus Liberibacter asiaticus]